MVTSRTGAMPDKPNKRRAERCVTSTAIWHLLAEWLDRMVRPDL